MEKLLLEATMELSETDAIVGMQDMGAAGITCSTCEMSAAGDVGMEIDLDKVPTRQLNICHMKYCSRISRAHACCGSKREGASCERHF